MIRHRVFSSLGLLDSLDDTSRYLRNRDAPSLDIWPEDVHLSGNAATIYKRNILLREFFVYKITREIYLLIKNSTRLERHHFAVFFEGAANRHIAPLRIFFLSFCLNTNASHHTVTLTIINCHSSSLSYNTTTPKPCTRKSSTTTCICARERWRRTHHNHNQDQDERRGPAGSESRNR